MDLTGDGVMHEGRWSTRLGLPGIPGLAEDVMVARDLLLLEETGGALPRRPPVDRAQPAISCARRKARGLAVTCEVTPHHLVLTDRAVAETGFDPNSKMNPPLRADERPRGAARRPRRRHDRRHRHRPRAAPRRREGSSSSSRRSGSSASRPRWRSASTGWCAPELHRPVAAGRAAHRAAARRACSASPGGTLARRQRRPTSRCSTSSARSTVDPARFRSQVAQHAVRAAGACAAPRSPRSSAGASSTASTEPLRAGPVRCEIPRMRARRPEPRA